MYRPLLSLIAALAGDSLLNILQAGQKIGLSLLKIRRLPGSLIWTAATWGGGSNQSLCPFEPLHSGLDRDRYAVDGGPAVRLPSRRGDPDHSLVFGKLCRGSDPGGNAGTRREPASASAVRGGLDGDGSPLADLEVPGLQGPPDCVAIVRTAISTPRSQIAIHRVGLLPPLANGLSVKKEGRQKVTAGLVDRKDREIRRTAHTGEPEGWPDKGEDLG